MKTMITPLCDPSKLKPIIANINEIFKKLVTSYDQNIIKTNLQKNSLSLTYSGKCNVHRPFSGDNSSITNSDVTHSTQQLYQSLSRASEELTSTISDTMTGKVFSRIVTDEKKVSEYKRVALESTIVLEVLVKMLQASFSMLREIPFIPVQPVISKAQELTKLINEAREKTEIFKNIQLENYSLKEKCAKLELELANKHITGEAVEISDINKNKMCENRRPVGGISLVPSQKSDTPVLPYNLCDEYKVYNNMYGSEGGIFTDPKHANGFTVFPWRLRYHKVEALYYEIYKGHGMKMIWDCIDTVFRHAYGRKAIVNKDEEISLNLENKEDQNSIPNYDATSYKEFFQDFNNNIVKRFATEEAFNSSIHNITPIQSHYISNCTHCRVKPNSGIVQLLSTLIREHAVLSLDFSGNYIGESGLFPLLPIISRFDQLTSLNLSRNGLRNDGVVALCKTIALHPSITSIDLSSNKFSRAAGKSILTLVSTVRRISCININDTNVDGALKQRILLRVLENFAGVPEYKRRTYV